MKKVFVIFTISVLLIFVILLVSCSLGISSMKKEFFTRRGFLNSNDREIGAECFISVRQECAGRCGSDRGRQREHGCDLYLRCMGQYAVSLRLPCGRYREVQSFPLSRVCLRHRNGTVLPEQPVLQSDLGTVCQCGHGCGGGCFSRQGQLG